jgi:hypothetical protein
MKYENLKGRDMWHLQERGEVHKEGHVALTGERRGT